MKLNLKNNLRTHLLWIVIIKMLLLYGLWFLLIKPNKVKVNTNDLQQLYSRESGTRSITPNHSLGVQP